MGYQIAQVGLAPVLFAQGRRVRKMTVRLPEPAGEREGVAGEGRTLRLLVVGDSAAAGVGASTLEQALPGQLVARLQRQFRVEWRLIAKTGATAPSTVRHLSKLPPARFDVAVTSLGINDATSGASTTAFIRAQEQLAELLREQFGCSLMIISGLPAVHKLPALPQPLRWYLSTKIRRFDRALATWTKVHSHCQHVPLHHHDDMSFVAADGFHPAPAYYALWANDVASRVQQHFEPKAETA